VIPTSPPRSSPCGELGSSSTSSATGSTSPPRLPRPCSTELRDAFDQSVKTSGDLNTSVDAALVEAGRKIADQVDDAVANGVGMEVTKALYLVPHMLNVLREMLATPASRKAAADKNPPTPTVEGKLAQLRSVAKRADTG
jgi:hypothetical protein